MGRKRREPGNYFHCDEQPIDQQVGERIKRIVMPWKCRWRYDGQERYMYVCPDYLYDGGSIPRIGWTALGITPSGPGDKGFLPHDVLYRAEGGLKPDCYGGCTVTNSNGNLVVVSRGESDWVMYAALRNADIPAHRARIAWLAVRALGSFYWGGPMPVPK